MLKQMANMVKAIFLADSDKVADNAFVGIPMRANKQFTHYLSIGVLSTAVKRCLDVLGKVFVQAYAEPLQPVGCEQFWLERKVCSNY